MIKNVFFDLDECLAYTRMNTDPLIPCLKFSLSSYLYAGNYYTVVHPRSNFLIDYARKKVGYENVFILTAAVKEYASEINKLAEFGFAEENILSREIIEKHSYSTTYNGSNTLPLKDIAHTDNILIDNLLCKYNSSKMDLIGISSDRYLQVRSYYGLNQPNDDFEVKVREFVDKTYNEKD